MADTLKVLGQVAPGATTATDLYEVPGATSAVISSIVIVNRSTATTFRVSVAVAGAVLATKQYVAFDVPLGANEVKSLSLGISMAATDVLRVFAGTANVSFSAFGVEVS